ncbi:MAG: phosphodiester glycosidase family protein [Anaerolineae bacterium]|nr:phosphodiester glycosidase family protein [Anaerolineae bacterium]
MRSPGVEKTQERIGWGDGTFSDYTAVRFSPAGFRFLDIDQQEPQVKLKDAGYLRWVKALGRGATAPRIVAFLRLERDRAVGELFPGLQSHTEAGEELLSANSLITHTLRTLLACGWLRCDGGRWQPIVPARESAWRQRGQAVLSLLEGEKRLHLELGPGVRPPDRVTFDGFDALKDLIPVGRLGFPRELVWRERPRLLFNTAFFLLEHHDFFSFHSALGEPYGLFVEEGIIRRPPLYRRAALCQRGDGSWQAALFSMADLEITLPDGTRLICAEEQGSGEARERRFSLNAPAEVTLYTRAYGLASQGRVPGCTPAEPGRVELTVIERRVVGWKADGGLDIPQNGFVLSFAPGVLKAESLAALRARPRVSYRFLRPEHQGIVQALQAGPLLLQGGRSALTPTRLAEEEFWVDRPGDDGSVHIGIVPTEFPDDVDRTRAARIGLGVDGEGQLAVVAVAGAEKGARLAGVDSQGATLAELTALLAEAGALEAINLDGGGSTQLFFLGGLTIAAGGRLGLPGVHYERMVPSVGLLP